MGLKNSGFPSFGFNPIGFRKMSSNAQAVKDAGGVLYLDARKADGFGKLTGNQSPFVDLSGNSNDGALNNFAGSGASGWQDGPPVLRFDGVDDFVAFADAVSLDITNAPLAIGVTMKAISFGKYIFSRNLDSSATVQYGMFLPNSSNVSLFLDGNQINIPVTGMDEYINIVLFWDGVDIKAYKNNYNIYDNPTAITSLATRPNVQLGARSASVDGLSKALFFDGDICTQTIYAKPDLDINKIKKAEARISAEYLALNP